MVLIRYQNPDAVIKNAGACQRQGFGALKQSNNGYGSMIQLALQFYW
jgi:hypothetical protein